VLFPAGPVQLGNRDPPYFDNALYVRYDNNEVNYLPFTNVPANNILSGNPDWKDNAYVREQTVKVYQCADDPFRDMLESPGSGPPSDSPPLYRHGSIKRWEEPPTPMLTGTTTGGVVATAAMAPYSPSDGRAFSTS